VRWRRGTSVTVCAETVRRCGRVLTLRATQQAQAARQAEVKARMAAERLIQQEQNRRPVEQPTDK
jgi:hypothetical protein